VPFLNFFPSLLLQSRNLFFAFGFPVFKQNTSTQYSLVAVQEYEEISAIASSAVVFPAEEFFSFQPVSVD